MRNGIIIVILLISCVIAQRQKPTPHCPILAIKIGYTNIHSCISIDGKVINIIDEYGNQKIPNQYKFSEEYREETDVAQQNIKVGLVIPLIGKKFSEVEKIDGLEFVDMDDQLYIQRGRYIFTPSDLLSQLIMETMQMSQGKYDAYQSILIVPAHFDSTLKESIYNTIKFVSILEIIDAPIATIMAHNLTKNGLVLVVHFGSTAEFSLVKLWNGQTKIIGTNYDTTIDIDQVIIQYLNTVLQITDQQKLIPLIAGFKHEFITQSNSKIVVEDQEYIMNRDEFKQLIDQKLNQVMDVMITLLKEINIEKEQIDNIILTGGAIPLLKDKLYEYFENNQFLDELHAEDAECFGGAILGEQICTKHQIHNSGNMATDLSYGIEMAGGIMKILVDKNSQIPLMPITHVFELFLKKQKTAHLYFYQGERVLTKFNKQIAELHFQDLDAQEITVQVNSDSHFNLNFIVKCGRQQKEISIPIENSKNAQQIIREAIDYQEEDEYERNLIEKISLKTREKQVSKQDGQIWFQKLEDYHTDL